MSIKRTVSFTLVISFILLAASSVAVYVAPAGRIAYWADWRLLGMTKSSWGALHINLGWLFLAASLLHIYFNWRLIVGYMKNAAKRVVVFTREFNVALVITLVVAFGTFFEIPPLQWVIDFSEFLGDEAAKEYGEPPYPHAELSTIKTFAKKVGVDFEKARELLTKQGSRAISEEQTVLEIAKQLGVSPQDLYLSLRELRRGVASVPGELPEEPPSGIGRKSLAELSAQFGLNLPEVLSKLKSRGFEATPEKTLKELAAEKQGHAMEVYQTLRADL